MSHRNWWLTIRWALQPIGQTGTQGVAEDIRHIAEGNERGAKQFHSYFRNSSSKSCSNWSHSIWTPLSCFVGNMQGETPSLLNCGKSTDIRSSSGTADASKPLQAPSRQISANSLAGQNGNSVLPSSVLARAQPFCHKPHASSKLQTFPIKYSYRSNPGKLLTIRNFSSFIRIFHPFNSLSFRIFSTIVIILMLQFMEVSVLYVCVCVSDSFCCLLSPWVS